MPFVPTLGVFEWLGLLQLFNQVVQIGHHFQTTSTMDESYLGTVASDVLSAFASSFQPHLSQRISRTGAEAISQVSASSPKGVYVESAANSGGVSEATGIPASGTCCIKKATASRGRSYRGRMYMPGIPQSALVSGDANTLNSTFISNLLGDTIAFLASIAISHPELTPVVVSKFSGIDSDGKPIPRAAGVKTPVTVYTINNQMDSQRRRLTGRGT